MTATTATIVTPTNSRDLDGEYDTVDWLSKLESGAVLNSSDCEKILQDKNCLSLTQKKFLSLQSWNGKLVRVHGMVQDMLDVEYFSPHSGSSGSADLLERRPLVISPLDQPGNNMTEWFCSMHREQHPMNKRMRFAGDIDTADETSIDEGGMTRETSDQQTTNISQQNILAYFYHDQYEAADSVGQVRLNDIIELIGVLDVPPNCRNTNEGIFYTNGSGTWEEEDLIGTDCTAQNDWHMPRLHVLWYDTSLDLDALVASTAATTSLSTNAFDNSISRHFSSLIADELAISEAAATALYMTLLSMAERECLNESSCIWTPVSMHMDESTLGCASLNMVLSETTAGTSDRFQARLKQVLSHILPHVLSLNVTTELLHTLHLPGKRNGQLVPTLLQLAKGSTLILNICDMQEGKLSAKQAQTLEALKQLTATHKISYSFDGDIRIPFEADVRIIVLSTRRGNKLLPCCLQVECDSTGVLVASEEGDLGRRLEPVRKMLAASRAPLQNVKGRKKYHNNIDFSTSLLKRAQQDFIALRTRARQDPSSKALPTEKDFHRWLTLTRLFARSRRSKTAELQDWIQALRLDNSMLQTGREQDVAHPHWEALY